MQHGWRRQRSTFRSVSPPFTESGLALVPHHCFTLRSPKLLSCPRERPCLLVLLRSSSRSLRRGECPRARSEPCRMSPFLDFSHSHRDSYHGPCHWTCHCLYLGAPRTGVSVLNYAKGCLSHTMLVVAVLEWRSE